MGGAHDLIRGNGCKLLLQKLASHYEEVFHWNEIWLAGEFWDHRQVSLGVDKMAAPLVSSPLWQCLNYNWSSTECTRVLIISVKGTQGHWLATRRTDDLRLSMAGTSMDLSGIEVKMGDYIQGISRPLRTEVFIPVCLLCDGCIEWGKNTRLKLEEGPRMNISIGW